MSRDGSQNFISITNSKGKCSVMEKPHLDIVGVYAHADSAHLRERELWRGFLSYALPLILSMNSKFIDQCITDAIVYSFEELTYEGGNEFDTTQSLRCISTILAKEIGVSQEFALAAFYEGQVPTKLYKIKNSPQKKSVKTKHEDNTISQWLTDLSRLQSDNRFLNQVEKWKSWLYISQNEKAS